MRPIFQALLLSTVIIAVVWFLSYKTRDLRHPDLNIVLISVDTARPDHLSTYGYDRETDPHLKELSKQATVFQNAYTLIPQTYPSFAMLFTGKSPSQTGIFSNASPQRAGRGNLFQNTRRLNDDTKTLASIVKNKGYRTVGFVTSGILHDDFTGLGRGFDSYAVFEQYDINEWKQKRGEYEAFIDKSAEWFTDNNKQKFFYWIHLMDPHSPYYPQKENRCLFQSENDCELLQSQQFQEVNSFNNPYYACSQKKAPDELVKRYEALYDAEITSSDRHVGKIINALEENNLMGNTLIIYYGDHGESFDHQYYFAHGESLYDSTIRIPLVIYNPLNKAQQFVMKRMSNIDILPTILDLVQIPYTKDQFTGESLLPEMSRVQRMPTSDEYTFFSNYNLTKFGVMKGPYKYILSLPGACLYGEQNEELYDTVSDPDESNNLVTMKKEMSSELKTALETYISGLKIEPVNEETDSKERILDELKSLGY